MTVTLNLRPEVEAEIAQKAVAQGATLPDYIEKLIAEAVKRQPLPPLLSPEEQRKKNQAAIDMLNEWDEEDKTDDPEEIARRQAEWEAFKKGMNENHSSNRIIYP